MTRCARVGQAVSRWQRAVVPALAGAGLLAGCAGGLTGASTEAVQRQWVWSPAYYWQAAAGHLAVVRQAEPVADWLAREQTPAPLRQRLQAAQRIRQFAVTELHLPDNASYTRYADLGRRAAVWNVVATPAHALTLQPWCYPLLGCQGYRGYYSEAAARELAASLPADWDVAVYPVIAYSTLGWGQWLGGDPLLNTFIHYPEGEVARTVFHELAHQVVYAGGDTAFNEAFATAVESLGGERWLAQADAATRDDHARFDARRQAFRALLRHTRAQLAQVYANSADPASGKRAVMAEFKERYGALKAGWGGYAGYDIWVAQANNALFAVQAAYDDLVPGFLALFEQQGQSFPHFYQAVRELARRPQGERHAALRALAAHTEATLTPAR